MALGKFVRQMLRREAGQAPAEQPQRVSRRSPLQDLEDGSISLEEVLRHRPETLGTVLHVITVRKIREILGAEWPVYAQKIYAIAERLFMRHLGPYGMYALHEEDTFLFAFGAAAATRPEDEEAKSADIATDLMRWLIGDSFAGAEIGVATLPVAEARTADGGLDPAAIAKARERARIIRAGDIAATDRPSARDSAEPAGARAQAPDWIPLPWPPEGIARDGDRVFEIALPRGLHLGFRPVWQARTERVELAACEPMRLGEDGKAVPLGRARDPDALAAVELAVLQAALAGLEAEIARRSGLSLIVPLSLSTVTGSRDALVTAIAAAAPAGARGRHLFLELRGLAQPPAPGGAALAADQVLPQAVARLRALCRDVLIDCSEVAGQATLQGIIPIALGTRLRPKAGGAAAPHNAAELRRLTETAGAHALYLWGLPADLVLAPELRRRLAFVSGPAVGNASPQPPELRALPAAELFAA